ncbi:TPP1 [Branchiostoma lanceolatum]|uniref:TPP1 protein n=1 Tax=Branchiostoma lanceolatum TaxID=7740 RepID=A0A8K0F1J4_BRALA|nr:TPP1 [Branchiostoma lanceolatum]
MRVAVGLCVLFAGFSAVLSWSFEYVHLEPGQSTSVPEGWTRIERVAPDEDLKLTFALKQQNVDVLEDLFWKVSDPTHEEYGHYLSLEEIADILKPSNKTVTEVGRWLEGSGVADCSTIITKDFMECSMSTRTAERLLGDIKFHRYTDGERTVIRSEANYRVPSHLKDHLDFGLHEGQEPFLEFLQDLSDTSVVPYVISISYGDHERTLSVEYMKRINVEFQKAGVRGLTIKEAVASYLKNVTLPDAKYFNPTNRAYPDISAMSDDFWIIINRLLMNVAGTSAATPVVAGILSMANDARLNAGKPVLGFFNPLLYSNPQMLFDVTLGNPSEACWLDDLEGYRVAQGWDPVTGLGTPDYNKVIKAVMKY